MKRKLHLTALCIFLAAWAPVVALGHRMPRNEPPVRPPGQPPATYVLHRMKLGCERAGVHLDLVVTDPVYIPMEASEHIRLSYGKLSLLLRQINDLRGHVRIADGPTALRYVRLLTSPETWYLWEGREQCEVEIIEAGSASSVPNYGLKEQPLLLCSPNEMVYIKGGFTNTHWLYDPRTCRMRLIRSTFQSGEFKDKVLRTMKPPDFTVLGDGDMGVVTRRAFRASGFSPASVIPVPGGFHVTRWLYVERHSAKGEVQRVQEFVGRDGECRRTILKILSPPPSLPGTRFTLPMFF